MNLLKLKIKCVENSISQQALADAIGISISSLQRKFHSDKACFTVGEIERIKKALHLSDEEAIDVFFRD